MKGWNILKGWNELQGWNELNGGNSLKGLKDFHLNPRLESSLGLVFCADVHWEQFLIL